METRQIYAIDERRGRPLAERGGDALRGLAALALSVFACDEFHLAAQSPDGVAFQECNEG